MWVIPRRRARALQNPWSPGSPGAEPPPVAGERGVRAGPGTTGIAARISALGVGKRAADTLSGLRYLARASGVAFASWFLLAGVACAQALSVLGVGFPLLSVLLRTVERTAARDLRMSSELLGRPLSAPAPKGRPGSRPYQITGFWRELRWTGMNAVAGLPLGLAVLVPALGAAICVTIPLWWWTLPPGIALTPALYPVDSWPAALAAPVAGLGHLALLGYLAPRLSGLHARLAHRALTSTREARLSARLAEVTTSRTEALEAHGAELRRIERDLHDGTQNRLVAVRMHLGIVERVIDPGQTRALELVRVAQGAAEEALAELREVVRSIYPPILADRGLGSAVASLAARSAVPCRVEAGDLAGIPAAVEATAYFAVAECLTNVAKHGGASRAWVRISADGRTLRVEVGDDGAGGADERAGTGLAGIRRRVAAFDGSTEVASPPGGPTTIRVELPCAC
ncbi:histidine kinase [Marinitenerispora sediminis]|uniref:histidine kinase n=1 Tax=Marinitenerispora sediminis TaxID=1931232 RepID=A0A368T7U5_9ACTN|nr:sensor histidine kinase [Marinitenerispora sediminis]RCV51204.1 histidine kinase [Marinitenerispora sediminis]RCV56446.1 histidine kinase [Marinitenerispora sediminis]RCV60161.1 histidine kinase [Marinitenerispora sediminis]